MACFKLNISKVEKYYSGWRRYDMSLHEPPCQNKRGFRANNDYTNHNYFFSSFKIFGFKYTINFVMNNKKMTDVN